MCGWFHNELGRSTIFNIGPYFLDALRSIQMKIMMEMLLWIFFRLNCSFNLLTFSKLRFWPLRKKTTKQPPKFCNCSSFGPQGWYWLGLCWRGTLSEVPHVIFFIFFCVGGPKLLQLQNLRGCFVVFFLRGPKSQLWES